MIDYIFRYIFYFVLLVTLQVLVLNHIQFMGYVNPYLYVLFILIFPLTSSREAFMLLCFALGMAIDLFSNTHGAHAFACVFIAFFRKPILRLFVPLEGHDIFAPTPGEIGKGAFFRYATAMVVVHHALLFMVDAFTFVHFGQLMMRMGLSVIFTLLLIGVGEAFGTSKA